MKLCGMSLKSFICVALAAAILTVNSYAVDVSAECAVLLDAGSGRVLYQKNMDSRHLIASTTKIMTALVALDLCDMEDVVIIPPEAARVEGSSMYLEAGQERTCEELLTGLMLMSGNDAAVALAIHCSGSVDRFVARMNKKAGELGLKNTSFANPHGLDAESHYSTAHDLALLAAAAMRDGRFAAIVSKKLGKVGNISVRNHNRLLWTIDGCEGVKTGFTKSAGRCLVSSTTRDGRRLLAVTLNAPNDWRDHAEMVEYGFSDVFETVSWKKGEQIAEVPVFAGIEAFSVLEVAEEMSVCLTRDEAERSVIDIELPRYIWAPVRGGRAAGRITVRLDGELVASVDLINHHAIEEIYVPPQKWWHCLFNK